MAEFKISQDEYMRFLLILRAYDDIKNVGKEIYDESRPSNNKEIQYDVAENIAAACSHLPDACTDIRDFIKKMGWDKYPKPGEYWLARLPNNGIEPGPAVPVQINHNGVLVHRIGSLHTNMVHEMTWLKII